MVSAGPGWEPDDLRIREQVVEERADVLDALRAPEVQQEHTYLGHGLAIMKPNITLRLQLLATALARLNKKRLGTRQIGRAHV